MTASPRTARLPLVLIRLGALCAALVLIAGVVQAQTPSVLTSNTGLTVLADDELNAIGGGSQQADLLPLPLNHERAQRFASLYTHRPGPGIERACS